MSSDTERLASHYLTMRRIRAFEDRAEQMAREGQVTGAVHASVGQEAIAAGVCANLGRADKITTTHRGHGHAIAKGTDPRAMMLELFGKAGGTSGGKGGSMHIADFSVGMLGANGVVAAGIPIAVGAAHALRMRGTDDIVACFFGYRLFRTVLAIFGFIVGALLATAVNLGRYYPQTLSHYSLLVGGVRFLVRAYTESFNFSSVTVPVKTASCAYPATGSSRNVTRRSSARTPRNIKRLLICMRS